MARSFRGSFPVRRSQRRQTSWDLGPGGTQIQQFSSTTPIVLGAGVAPLVDGLTVVRIRGEFTAYLTNTDAAAAGLLGAVGIGKGSQSAFTAGVGSLETPIADEGWDGWLYHRFFALTSGGAIAGGAMADHDAVNPTTAALRIEIDSKAMRKLDIEDILYAVVEFGTEIGTSIAQVSFNSRLLLKLA